MIDLLPLSIFLFFSFNYVQAINSSIIKFPLTKHFDSFEIISSIGDSNEEIKFSLDLNANYTLFWNKRYPSTTKNVLNSNVQLLLNKGSTITTQELKDNFYFLTTDFNTSLSLNDYPFFFYEHETEYSLKTPHLIGMSHRFINSRYSLIHQLKELGLIQSLSFSIVKDKNYKKYLCLGGIINEETGEGKDEEEPKQHHSTCSIRKEFNTWSCTIQSVSIKKQFKVLTYYYKYNKDDYITFSSATSIYAPKSFIDYYQDSVIADGLKSKQCHISGLISKKYFQCNEEYVRQFGDIVFRIDNYDYSFKMYNGWSCFDGYCDFDIIENPNDKNQWIVGAVFFDRLDMLFDYENAQIHFYSPKLVKINSKIDSKQVQLLLMIIISIMGLIGAGLIRCLKPKMRRSDVINTECLC